MYVFSVDMISSKDINDDILPSYTLVPEGDFIVMINATGARLIVGENVIATVAVHIFEPFGIPKPQPMVRSSPSVDNVANVNELFELFLY